MSHIASTTDLDRKALKRPDDFVVTARRVFGNLSQYRKYLAVIGALLIATGIGGAIYANYREDRAATARDRLYLAHQGLEKQLKELAKRIAPATEPKSVPAKDKAPQDEAEEPQENTGLEAIAYQKLDVDTQLGESVERFRGVIQQFTGSHAALEARLALGDLYFDHGEAGKAIPWYRSAAEAAPRGLDRSLAFSALAYAHENAKEYREATNAFQQALDQGEVALKGDLMLGLARAQELAGDASAAARTYDKIIEQHPGTPHAKTAELQKSQIAK